MGVMIGARLLAHISQARRDLRVSPAMDMAGASGGGPSELSWMHGAFPLELVGL